MKEEIGTKTLGLYDLIVVKENIVKVAVLIIGKKIPPTGLSNPTGSMNEHFIKTPGVRQVFLFVPEVPFSKDSRFVPCFLQCLGKCDHIEG